MTIDTNYGELYARNNEMHTFKQVYSTVVQLCFAKKFDRWSKLNKPELDKLGTELTSLYVLHIQPDGKGGWAKDEQGKPVFKSPEDEIDFNESWKNIMQMPCKITL